jgi:hypothetical protein
MWAAQKKAGKAGRKVNVDMSNIRTIGATTQSPLTTNPVADFGDAIRNARFALHNGPLDGVIVHLEDARRLAAEANNPHAHELANLVGAAEPAVETLKLVEMCFLDLFPE